MFHEADNAFSSTPARVADERRLAAFDVVGPRAGRVTIDTATATTTVADLARLLGICAGTRSSAGGLLIDGREAPWSQTLLHAGVRHGSVVKLAMPQLDDAAPPVVEAMWIGGADAGRTLTLPAGQWVVGRSRSAAVRTADPLVELHHGLLDIDPSGAIVFHQLSGQRSVLLDGLPVDGPTDVAAGQRLDIGGATLSFREAGPDGRGSEQRAMPGRPCTRDDPWRMSFVRSPRVQAEFRSREISPPRITADSGWSGGGLLPALIGIAGSAIAAVAFGQPMFLLFGAIGGAVAVATWIAQRVGGHRSRAAIARENIRAIADFTAQLEAQRIEARDFHVASAPTLASAVVTMHERASGLWSTRTGDSVAFTASVGEGAVVWAPSTGSIEGLPADVRRELLGAIDTAAQLGRLPVLARIAAGTVTALVGGDVAVNVARSLVLQLAAASGPADWQLTIITDHGITDDGASVGGGTDGGRWRELTWLPHATDSGGGARLAAVADAAEALAAAGQRHHVVLTDEPALLATRTSALRRLLATGASVAVIVVCAAERDVPALATSVLTIGRFGEGRWVGDARTNGLAEPVRPAGASALTARDAAASIACLIDPEAADSAAGLPSSVDLAEIVFPPLDGAAAALADRVTAAWAAAGRDPALAVPIGVGPDGPVDIDLVLDGPHALVAGTTGSGKSELLRALVVGLAARLSPDHVTFVLVDYKGGAAFAGCAALPHVVGLVTDLDDHLARRALRSLDAELRRRERILRDAGAVDLGAYRQLPGGAALPRLVVIVDEFAALAVQQAGFLHALLGIAQRGRSLGVHLVLATQRPAGVVSDDIRANTNLRIALRVQDASDSVDVVGVADASVLPRGAPGRALVRIGADDPLAFQAAQASVELVDAVTACARRRQVVPSHRPWLPPLAERVMPAGGDEAFGVVDDPDGQAQRPLHWDHRRSHLLLAAATGFGATSTLLRVAEVTARQPDVVHLYVIDAIGDHRLALLRSLPNCIAVVAASDHELLARLLADVSARLDRATSPGMAPAIVLIDGIAAVRAELDGAGAHRQLDQFDAIIAGGLAAGVSVVATTNHAPALPSRVLSQFAERWVFHLSDAGDAVALGVAVADVPPAIPGRIVVASESLEAQLFEADEHVLLECACSFGPGDLTVAARRDRLRPLASEIAAPALASPLAIAVAFDDLAEVLLPDAPGDHLLIAGPSRSGRSSALLIVAERWLNAHPNGVVLSVVGRRGGARPGRVCADVADLVASLPAGRDVLIVIDDAELVDDAGGWLAGAIASRHEGITVAAAGRAESLRSLYGHWTSEVRKCRLGLVMAMGGDLDGDLLGACLPRRLPVRARPGLAWLIADGGQRLVQLALPDNQPSPPPARHPSPPLLDAVGVAPPR